MATKPTLLIIDDDPEMRGLYRDRFKEAGFEILEASNGEDGLEIALSQQPSAILLDVMMPKKGGLGVLEILKTMPATKDIPVLILTAYPADEYKEKSLRYGAMSFLSKSETMPGDIVEKVKVLLSMP
ncbi:MAG: response regulator [Patescibacteria group bacterium]